MQAAAGSVQVTGNLAFSPHSFGRFTVVDISSSTNLNLLSTYPDIGGVTGIALHDHYAFTSVGNDGLNVFDLSVTPPQSLARGGFATPGEALDLRLKAPYAFIADGENGIAIVDIFEPDNPLELPSLFPGDRVSGLDVTNNYLYAACGEVGVKVFDFTDILDVANLGDHYTASPARHVRVAGNHLYVACDGGRLEIINRQNPAALTLTATFLAGGTLAGLDVVGNFAVLGLTNGNLIVLNISNPAAPVAQSTNFVVGGIAGFRVVGVNAYVRTATGTLVAVPLAALPPSAPQLQETVTPQLVAAGQTAVLSALVQGTPPLSFQWRHNGVPLLDDARISGSTNEWLRLATTELADAGVYSVTVSNALGQLVSSNTLTVVTPGTPWLRGEVIVNGGDVQGVDLDDFRAYISAGVEGIRVYDILNPRQPQLVGFETNLGEVGGIRVEAEYSYLASGLEGLQVLGPGEYGVTTPIAATNTAGTTRAIFLSGGLAYVADGENGLQVFRLHDKGEPQLDFVGAYDTQGYAWNVFVAVGRAYVADGTNGVQILNATNPAALTLLGTYDTPGEARNVKVSGATAYVADNAAGLIVLDVANPTSPALLGIYPNAIGAIDLEVVGDLAIVACGVNGLHSLNIANPAAISLRGTHPVAPANALRIEGKFVYVAAGANGLKILELIGVQPSYPDLTVSSDLILTPGETAVFSATVTDTVAVTYHWYRDGLPLFDPATAGDSGAVFTRSNVSYADADDYRIIVRNAWNLAVSASVNLLVVPVGTPAVRFNSYSQDDDALSTHVVGQVAFVASRTNGLQVIDLRDPLEAVLISQHPTLDLAQHVHVQGRYAYVASWRAGLEIFDVWNPTNLVRVGHCDTPGLAHHLQVQGQRVHVADRAGGYTVVDVSDPTRPAIVGRAATGGFAEGVAVTNHHVFVAASSAGLEVFDVSNPLAPTRVGGFDSPGNAESVTLGPGRAYLADFDRGLLILDVNNPAAPAVLGGFQTRGDLFDVQLVGPIAYLAEGINKVSVLAITNAGAPTLITTSLAGRTVHSLHVSGKHALLADREAGLVVAELLGYAAVAPEIIETTPSLTAIAGRELVLSVASSGTPPLTFTWSRNGAPLPNSATVIGANQPHLRFPQLASTNAGDYTVVVANAQGSATSSVATLTVATLGTPVARGVFDSPGLARASVAFGNIAFVADDASGLQMVNLTNIDQPTAIGTFPATGTVAGLFLQTNLLYLALGPAGVRILDVTNPAAPVPVGAFATPGTALNLFVTNGQAFVAAGSAGLQIYNLTNPAVASPVGALDTTGTASDVQVINDYAYVADGGAGLKIITITNPAAPLLLGMYSNAAPAHAVRVVTNRAYVANGNLGLLILDVTNPAAPLFLGSFPTTNATALDVAGNFVVLADGAGGYRILDVSNPAAVTEVGSANPGDAISGAMLIGNFAFLASGTNGLRLVELSGVAPLAPAFVTQPTNTTVLFGGNTAFHALPLGGTPPVTCRWYFNGFPVFDDARISGAATPHLVLTNIGFTDAGQYQLRVFGPAGVTNSSSAQLTFIGPLQAQLNTTAPGSVVTLAPGTYTETLVVDRDLTLAGSWWNKPVLSGGGAGPVLQVLPGASVTLRGLALRNGFSTGAGGGIWNEGNLTLEHCLVADNSAQNGGGIANFGNLVLHQSVVSNNAALAAGGGLYTATNARSTLTNATLIANVADFGGGLANLSTNTLDRSLVAYNLATGAMGQGGGLWASAGFMQLINTTVSGNTASFTGTGNTGRGGGLYASGGHVELHFTTVAANAALTQGGGLAVTGSAEVVVRNSVFATNTAETEPDFSGPLVSAGYNLVQSATGLTVTGDTTGNQLDVQAQLGPLRDNGGPTWTHAPAATSPIIDAGAAPGPATDARGIARAFDFAPALDLASTFDLGAVEYVDRAPYLLLSDPTANSFTLSWNNNAVLQYAFQLDGPWMDDTNPSPLFVSTMNHPQGFFRLRVPIIPSVLTRTNVTATSFALSWPDFGILERSPTPVGPWDAVSGVSPVQVEMIPSENEFFRLRVLEN